VFAIATDKCFGYILAFGNYFLLREFSVHELNQVCLKLFLSFDNTMIRQKSPLRRGRGVEGNVTSHTHTKGCVDQESFRTAEIVSAGFIVSASANKYYNSSKETNILKTIIVEICSLGRVVVSVLVTGSKGRGFAAGRGDGFLRAIKIRSTTSFGWEVKPDVPCRKILRHVKDQLTYKMHRICEILIPSPIPPTCSRCR
jgi:hypothetical protein